MLFDEPTPALDPELVRDVLAVMYKLAIEGIPRLVTPSMPAPHLLQQVLDSAAANLSEIPGHGPRIDREHAPEIPYPTVRHLAPATQPHAGGRSAAPTG
jgi:hypothetical protein